MKLILITVAVSALAAGGGYFFSDNEQHMIELANDSLRWPSVSGVVTLSNLDGRNVDSGQYSESEMRVEVSYEYVIDGERYENDVVRFDQQQLSVAEKELLVSTHPVGKQVAVFYDPANPGESVLVRRSWLPSD